LIFEHLVIQENRPTENSRMQRNFHKFAIASLALAAAFAHAQTQHQPPDPAQMVQHRVSFLTDKLGLSSSQQQQATSIFTDEMSAARSLHDQMKPAHQSLRAAVKANDSAGIEQASGTIGSLTAQMISARAKADAAFYQLLNPDQQSKYSQMHSHEPGMHGFRGRDGAPPF
jgi:Spy/CpxP family protein refolding chaperone